ncbi:MAG: leucine-rich repeat domain-containing protein [Flavobacteriales bacterium]|nr:leucine-rich repeat domain-containing protein [Flavobacteriales bacterium]
MKNGLILFIGLLSWGVVRAESTMDYQKTVANTVAYKDALSIYQRRHENKLAKNSETKLVSLLDELASADCNYNNGWAEYNLSITDGNREKVSSLCNQMNSTLEEIRSWVIENPSAFSKSDGDLQTLLSSKNPGDFYIGIGAYEERILSLHPLKEEMESIQLQDYAFAEGSASDDPDLWEMGKHCPNLSQLTLFGAEITVHDLKQMNLNAIAKLKVLDLAENYLVELPADFNQNNTLVYLALRQNELSNLPENLATWTNLKYLDLRDNPIGTEEQSRIKEALPDADIRF